jgi:uncharacterized protein YkwD
MFSAAKPTLLRVSGAAAAAAAAFALAVPGVASAHCRGANANPNAHGVTLKRMRHATLCLLNAQRRANGLGPLNDNGDLGHASRRYARDMAANNFFQHGDFIGRIRGSNYLSGVGSWSVGENIAWGSGYLATPKSIVNSWMHSPGHRANILSGGFSEIGIGIARGAPVGGIGDGATYVTDFGRRG